MAAIVMQLKSNLIRVAFPFILASLSLLAATNQLSSYRIPEKLAEKGEFANVPKLDETPVEKPTFAEDPPNDSKKLPLAILHMGPHKTGTTTIQKALETFADTLNEDGWDASLVNNQKDKRLKKLENSIMLCIKSGKAKDCKRWGEALNATIQVGSERGMNLLMSDEAMAYFDFVSGRHWKQFSSLLQEHYRVRAILVYRRFYEWLPSYYHQQFKYEGRPHGNKLYIWPAEGGIAIPPITEYWNQFLNNTYGEGIFPSINQWDKETALPLHNVLAIKNRLEAQSISVTVVNYHSGDLLENFFCSTLPHGHRTCQEIKNRATIIKNKSPNPNEYDYDIIATAAQEAGLLRDDVVRGKVKGQIRKFLKRTNQTVERDLPLKCLEKSKENLLRQISYEAEEQLMPSLLPSFNASFAAAIAAHKFCCVDATTLLQNETWQSFLSSIRPE